MGDYDETLLQAVYSVGDACFVWGKTRRQIMFAMTSGKLKYRKTYGGKTTGYMITRRSLVSLWGEPAYDPIQDTDIEQE